MINPICGLSGKDVVEMSLMTKIKPVPQKLEELSGKIVLGTLADADFRINASAVSGELAKKSVEYLKKSLPFIPREKYIFMYNKKERLKKPLLIINIFYLNLICFT